MKSGSNVPNQELKDAVLLVGPTSAGKTPLGDLLEKDGLAGLKCAHFDFGARFRAVAAATLQLAELDAADLEVIRESMRTGALLTDEQFCIAHKILKAFLGGSDDGLVVLNGMPRHAGQAQGVEDVVRVVCVVELACDAETVSERIKLDTGGDRAERDDDLPALVARKLKIYEAQTRPLLGWYEEKGVPVLTVDVSVISTSADMKLQIDGRFLETARLEKR